MDYDFLVDVELDRVDWKNVKEASGTAEAIPTRFRELLAATNEDEASRAYWGLENHAVLQGNLYEASIYLVRAICAALVDQNRSQLVRSWLVELLFQICNGYYAETPGSSAAPADIVERCRRAARGALWTLYGELAKQEIKIVEDLIRLVEDDPARLSLIITKIPNYKPPVWTT